MFVIFFALFIFVFTIRENIRRGVIVFIVLFLGLWIWNRRHHLQDKKIFFWLSIAFILSVWSYLFFSFSSGHGEANDQNFIWTWTIQDTYTEWKYILATQNTTYVLYTQKQYTIGDEIFLSGRKSSWAFSGTASDQWFLSFDYVKWLKMKWRQWIIYEKNSFLLQATWSKLQDISWITHIKKNLQQKIISLYGKDRISGLVLWMLIGDRSHIPAGDYQNFISSGLVHIIAVSGGNIVMITVFLGVLFFFIPFYLRSGVILLCIIFYWLLCGLDSSVFRAVLTGGLSLLALFRGKEVPIWCLLSIAFIAMLIINPYYLVYDVWFLMSFGAVMWIILLSQRKISSKTAVENGKLKMENCYIWKPLLYIRKNYLQPSVGATIGVFPIIIFFMGQMNLLSIIGNLFVLPIIPFVMIYGFVSVFLFQLLQRNRLLLIEKFLILYVYKVSEISSSRGLYLSMDGWVKRILLMGFIGRFICQRLKNTKIDPDKKSRKLKVDHTKL